MSRPPVMPSPLPLAAPRAPAAPAAPAANASTSSSSSSGSSLETFVTDNWKAILAVAAVGAVVAGASYLYASSSSSAPAAPKGKKPAADKGEKTKKSKGEKAEKSKDKAAEKPPAEEANEPQQSTKEETKEERLDRAKKAKEKGNKYYSGKNYPKAIELYTEALQLAPDSNEAAVFYANRAACYAATNDFQNVIKDCNAALAIDNKYTKALNRRANAYESLEQYHEALVDLTAACILEGFKNEGSLRNADKIIKILGAQASAAYLPTRKLALPAPYFLNSYFDSFRNKFERVNSEAASNEGDQTYLAALDKLEKKKFSEAFEEVEKAISQGTNFMDQALNLRGTFRYLKGDFELAMDDLNSVLERNPNSTNTLIKRASVYFETKDATNCFADFDHAAQADPDDPDVYYHRGQAYFIVGDLHSAMNDYKKSIDLDSTVPFVHVQLAVIYFRNQAIQSSLDTFKAALEKFPQYGDLHNYYAEVLTELQQFEEASEHFEKAMKMNPENPLSFINKAFLIAKWKQDIDASIQLLNKAIEIDPMCELAHAHLGQLYIQTSKMDLAIQSYQKAVESSRTEAEVAQWFSCIEAAKAQTKVLEMYPEIKQATLGVAAGLS